MQIQIAHINEKICSFWYTLAVLQEGHLRRCSPSDFHLVQSADWWLNAFLLAYDYDIDVAYAVVLECLKWRHNFDVERQ